MLPGESTFKQIHYIDSNDFSFNKIKCLSMEIRKLSIEVMCQKWDTTTTTTKLIYTYDYLINIIYFEWIKYYIFKLFMIYRVQDEIIHRLSVIIAL